MKNLKQKIGAILLGVGLATGGYFAGHYTPKYVSIDKSFIEEFETMKPGFLDKNLEVIKGKFGHIELSNRKDINLLFLGNWSSTDPYRIHLGEIWINHKDNGKTTQTIYYDPKGFTKEHIEFLERPKNVNLKEMTLKEKLLWEKLYEELAK